MKKFVLSLSTFIVAFVILSVSVLQSASVSYVFATQTPQNPSPLKTKIPEIEYALPYPGSVLPDSPLWGIKALRDKVWFFITSSHSKKAELALLFADKRIGASQTLFEAKKPDIAFSTLSKGEKYLELAASEEAVARANGNNTSEFLKKLALASLKHRQIIETRIILLAPEDAKPEIIKVEDYSKNAYKASRDALNSKAIPSPKNPFGDQ